MMGVRKNIVLLAIGALLWCCDGDGNLLDLYPMEPIVNPEVGLLIGDNRIIHVDVDGRQRISGVTEKGVFATADRFGSFDFEHHPWQAAEGVVGFGNGMLVHAQTEEPSFTLRYSTDYGKTWTAYDKPVIDERFLAAGSVAVVQLLVSADRSIWLLCQHVSGEYRRALLYRVDLEQQQRTLVMEKMHATALTCGFVDSKNGWILYGSVDEDAGRVQVLRTENGGEVWTDGGVMDNVERPALTPITADDLLVYNQEGSAFRSMDGGMSFDPISTGSGGIITCQAVSPSAVYALLENGLAKSTDGGQSWATVDARTNGLEISGTAMDFHGERIGVVYGEDRLFITSDSGQSWNVLVYPYDYVLDHTDSRPAILN